MIYIKKGRDRAFKRNCFKWSATFCIYRNLYKGFPIKCVKNEQNIILIKDYQAEEEKKAENRGKKGEKDGKRENRGKTEAPEW